MRTDEKTLVERLRSLASEWRDISAMNDEQAARKWLGLEDGLLEVVADPDAYRQAVIDLVTGPDSTARRITGQLATAYTQGGAQLAGYSHQAAALATKRFKASLAVSGSVFMLTRAPEGSGNVLLQIDKDCAQPRSRVDLGKEREPVYAVDDVANMLFLRTATGTLVGYRL